MLSTRRERVRRRTAGRDDDREAQRGQRGRSAQRTSSPALAKLWAADGPREDEKGRQPTTIGERRNRRSSARSVIDPAPVQGRQLSPAYGLLMVTSIRRAPRAYRGRVQSRADLSRADLACRPCVQTLRAEVACRPCVQRCGPRPDPGERIVGRARSIGTVRGKTAQHSRRNGTCPWIRTSIAPTTSRYAARADTGSAPLPSAARRC